MSLFGQEGMEAPLLGSSATVKAATNGPSILEPVGEVFGKAADILLKDKKSKDAAKSDAVVGNFLNAQTAIADAVDQGKYNSAFGRSMMRKNFTEFVTNNPSLRKELIAMQKDVVGTVGIGSIVTKDSEAERLQKEQNSTLVREGLVNADASEDEFSIARNRLTASLEAKKAYDLSLQTINLEKARTGLEASQIDLLDKREAKASYDYMTGISGAGYDSFKASMDRLNQMVASKEIDPAAAQIEIERQFNDIASTFAVPLSKISSTEAAALMKPFELLKDTTIKIASGELTGEAAKRAYETALNLQKATAMQDPTIAKAAALSSIFSSDPTVVKLSIENSVAKFMGVNATPNPEEVANPFAVESRDTKGFKAYTDSLNKVINDPNASEANKAEVKTHLRNIIEGTKDYEGFIKKNPKGGIAIMDWIGTQGFLKAIKENPEEFSDIEGMKTILTEHYSNEVWGMVKREFKESSIVPAFAQVPSYVGKSENAPTLGNVEARPSPEGMVFVAVDSDNTLAVRKASELNKNLKPIINKTIKAMAHLEGHDNYSKAFQDVSETIFGTGAGDSELEGAAGGDELDDLELEDFKFPTISGGGLPKEVAQDTEFMGEVESLAADLEIPPSTILAVMDFETGGSFNPSQKNAAGSSATGLIQFMATTAKGLGTSTQELSGMSRKQQMKFVRKYFEQYKDKIAGGDARDVYMAVLFPKAIDKPDNYVLFKKGTLAYKQNKGLDKNGDGTVTKAEASRKVVSLVGKHEK